jgi:hypothetical protein
MQLLSDDVHSRQEPQRLTRRAIAVDPYAAWLADREAERRREGEPVRWVYRHAGSGRDPQAPGRRILARKEDAARQALSEARGRVSTPA